MTTCPSTDNRDGYDRWSEAYDGYTNSTVAVDDMAFPPLWAHLRDKRVLEVGCGTGRHTLRLAQAGNLVTGIDLSPGMLAVAREKLRGLGNVSLVEADFLQSGLSLRDFDAVVTALVLEHIADLQAFFVRIAASLKPGGAFYLSEIHPDRIAGGTQANFIDGKTGEAVRLTSYAHSEETIQAAARHAGLRLVLHRDIVGGQDLVRLNPDWTRHLGRRMIRIWQFETGA